MLPVLEGKLRRTIPTLLAHPSILAHTIYQALAFDTALRDEGFDLPGTTAIPVSSVTADGDVLCWKRARCPVDIRDSALVSVVSSMIARVFELRINLYETVLH